MRGAAGWEDDLDVGGQPIDEVAELRKRRAVGAWVPQQRPTPLLSEDDRERYELQLDAYQVQLEQQQARLAAYADQLVVAHHDGLTGTWLRHAGQQLLAEELQRAARNDTPLCIAFVDVDGLKARNDRDGHAAGDHALVKVAHALQEGLRAYDTIVRWGGDEFLCVLPGLREEEAVRRIDQARAVLARGVESISISAGIEERRAGETVEALVARADATLYESRGRHLRG